MIRVPHLETDITTACQLSCVACNHHVPLYRERGPKMASVGQVALDLWHLSKVLHADAWGALGGEPTLHPQLPAILREVRASGIANTIEVWTNGIALSKMKGDFWGAVDRIVLSRYAGKLEDSYVYSIEGVCRDTGTELRIMDERKHPNFKTLFEPVPTDAVATKAKFDGCFFRQFSRVVNEGYFYTCCCAPHMPVLVQGRPVGSDGIPVDGITEAQLRAYLERSEPLGACSICAGRDTAVNVQWSEEKQPALWLQKSGQLVQENPR